MLSWEKHSAKQTMLLETGLLLKKKKKRGKVILQLYRFVFMAILISDIILFVKKSFCIVK